MGEAFFVLTGGPGAGKTSVIAELAERGFRTVAEPGRAIIQEQRLVGGPGTHDGDRALYLQLQLARGVQDYLAAEEQGLEGPVFFDRGLVDLVGYCALVGLDVPEQLRRAVQRLPYAKRVFVFPPWQAIYQQDAERGQDFAEAEATAAAMSDAYAAAGHQPVSVPQGTVAERAEFILAAINA